MKQENYNAWEMSTDDFFPTTNWAGKEYVAARDLHKMLGVRMPYPLWITNRIKTYEYKEDTDYKMVINPDCTLSKEYYLTTDMANELCMVENTAQAHLFRKYFMECERMIQKNNEINQRRDYVEGLKNLLTQTEETEVILPF